MRPPLRLIADDLSGALDALVQFRLPNLEWPALAAWERPIDGTVAISTGTRDLPDDAAHARTSQLAPWLIGADLAYKKIDSRLRGPVAAEIAALIGRAPGRPVVVVPALPQQGRIVRAGCVETHGAVEPVDLRAALGRFGLDCTLAMPGDALPDEISLWDAVTDTDLDRVAETALAAQRAVTFCGSAGLAAALRRALGGRPPSQVPIAGPVLMLIGTDHTVALRQVSAIAASADHRVVRIGRDGRGADDVAARLASGRSCTVTVAVPAGGDRASAAATIAESFATLLARVPQPRTLFASGGETLQAVAGSLDAKGVRVLGQYDADIPVGTLFGGHWDGLCVVSKSGGFGGDDILKQILDETC